MNKVYLKEPERDNTGKIREPWDDKFYRALQRMEKEEELRAIQHEAMKTSTEQLLYLGFKSTARTLRLIMEAYKEFHSE